MGGFEGWVEGLELYPEGRWSLLKVFEQGWIDLIEAMLRKIK